MSKGLAISHAPDPLMVAGAGVTGDVVVGDVGGWLVPGTLRASGARPTAWRPDGHSFA
jgi:hypothetical protein